VRSPRRPGPGPWPMPKPLPGRPRAVSPFAVPPSPCPPPAHLHLGEPHPAGQPAALGGPQVPLPLEGALQGAELLRAEGGTQPPAAPAAGLLGGRALGSPLRPLARSWGQGRGITESAGPGNRGSTGVPRRPRRRLLPAKGGAAKRSLLLPPLPAQAGCSVLRSLRPGLEREPGRWSAEDARRGEPSMGVLRAWLLWDNHSTEKGALVILPCFGDTGKEGVGEQGSSFIPPVPEENVVCVTTHQRPR